MSKFAKDQIVVTARAGFKRRKGKVLGVLEPIKGFGGQHRYYVQLGVYVVYECDYFREDELQDVDVIDKLAGLA